MRFGDIHADRDAARVGVLDDRDTGLVVVVRRAPGRLRVDVVVVRHLLAVQLFRVGEATIAVGVQRRGLVRVLAVAKHVRALEGRAQEVGEDRIVGGRVGGGEPGGDGHVVRGGVLEGLGGEPLAGGQIEAALLDRIEDIRVPRGAGHDRDGGVVLGGGADHRRAADVDLLDTLVGRGARGDGLPERVEVDDHEAEWLHAELGKLFAVRLEPQVGEDPGVHARVQGLDPAVQALGEAGELLDLGDRHSGRGDLRGGRAGGNQLHTRLVQPTGELLQTRLVINTDQRSPDGPLRSLNSHGKTTFRPSMR